MLWRSTLVCWLIDDTIHQWWRLALSSLVTPGVTQSQRRCRSHGAGITTPRVASITVSVSLQLDQDWRSTLSDNGRLSQTFDGCGYTTLAFLPRVSYWIRPAYRYRYLLYHYHVQISFFISISPKKNPLVTAPVERFPSTFIRILLNFARASEASASCSHILYQQTLLFLSIVSLYTLLK